MTPVPYKEYASAVSAAQATFTKARLARADARAMLMMARNKAQDVEGAERALQKALDAEATAAAALARTKAQPHRPRFIGF